MNGRTFSQNPPKRGKRHHHHHHHHHWMQSYGLILPGIVAKNNGTPRRQCLDSQITEAETWKRRNGIPPPPPPPATTEPRCKSDRKCVVSSDAENAARKNICRTSTVLDLQCALTTSWNLELKVFTRSLYKSLPKRRQQVLKMTGHITKY